MRSRRCMLCRALRSAASSQHFAVADSDAPDDLAYTEEQYDLFTGVVDRLQADGYATGTVHCANSAAQLRHWNGGGYDPRRHYPVWAGPQRGCPLPGAAACPFSALYRHFCERAAARPMCELTARPSRRTTPCGWQRFVSAMLTCYPRGPCPWAGPGRYEHPRPVLPPWWAVSAWIKRW